MRPSRILILDSDERSQIKKLLERLRPKPPTGNFDKIMLPVIKGGKVKTIDVKEFVRVQPMKNDAGLAFYLDFKHGPSDREDERIL